ncbi:hypothetical protein HK102_003880 [Quaeritorhiza haematococci]|nr:hypothetical protein HK102_003880 [Quaeritorhiza haematococci]
MHSFIWPLILGLLVLTFRAHHANGLLIHGFNTSGHEIFAVEKDQPPTNLDVSLFSGRVSYDSLPFIVACALHDIAVQNPNITGKVTVTGFGPLAQDAICNGTDNGTLPCPDAIIIGTTQISGRYYKGELEPLQNYFAQQAKETGRNVIDDFYKSAYYDYKIGEYDAEWNWDKFTEYANILKNSGQPYGYKLYTYVHEELYHLMATIGRLVNVPLVEFDGTCGLKTQSWYDALEKYVRKPMQDGVLRINYNDVLIGQLPPMQTFLNDTNPTSDPLLHLYTMSKLFDAVTIWQNPVPDGMQIMSASYLHLLLTQNPTDTGYAFPPGFFTFIGGFGIVIPKHAKNKLTSWEFIAHFTDRTQSFLRRFNADGLIPPLESFADLPAYSTPFYEFAKKLMRRAIPSHYPGAPYRQYQDLETIRPFRMMMMEIKYKNFSAQVATERACEVIEYIFQRECDQTDYIPTISDCQSSNTKTMSFVWKTPQKCKIGAIALPPPVENIECAYIVPSSSIAIAMDAITALGASASSLYALGFLGYKSRAAIKAANLIFCQAIFLGSILLYVSVFLLSGPPSVSLCLARPWFLALGFGLLLGGFLVKMLQISGIFSAQLSTKRLDKNSFSWSTMLQKLAAIVCIEVASLIALSLNALHFNQITIVVLIGVNAALILYSSYTAWKSRKVPDAFNETKFVVVAILLISFTAIVILPVVMTLASVASQYLLVSLAINFATTISMAMFAVPKLYAAHYNLKANTSTLKANSNDNSGIQQGSAGNTNPRSKGLSLVGGGSSRPALSNVAVASAGGGDV